MPAFIRKMLTRRLMNEHTEGADLPGASTEVIDLQNDDDLDSLNGLDRGDGSETQEGQQAAAPAPEFDLDALKAIAAQADDESDAGKPQTSSVPMPRFNEVNERRKQAEQALAQAQAEIEQLRSSKGSTANVGELEEKYAEAMMDGNTKEAVAIRSQINQQIEHAAYLRLKQSEVQQRQAEAWDAQIDNLLKTNPWLETEEGAPVAEMIADMVEAKMAKGMSQFDALADVTRHVLPRLVPAGSAPAPSTDPRLANSIKRGAMAAANQAPAMQGGFGNRAMGAKSYDIDSISDEEFMKLSEEEKAQMRGG